MPALRERKGSLEFRSNPKNTLVTYTRPVFLIRGLAHSNTSLTGPV